MRKKAGITLESFIIDEPGEAEGGMGTVVWALDSQEAACGPCLGSEMGRKIEVLAIVSNGNVFDGSRICSSEQPLFFLSSDYKKLVLLNHNYHFQYSTVFQRRLSFNIHFLGYFRSRKKILSRFCWLYHRKADVEMTRKVFPEESAHTYIHTYSL